VRLAATPQNVTAAMPYRGACGFCGGPDARHRVWDSIADAVAAGDDVDDVADDFACPADVVQAIADRWDVERQGWRR
jgi:hypothetical protein